MNKTRSTWREPMVWMLVGLPLASVVIGFALLFAAVHPGREDQDTVTHTRRVGKMLVSAQSERPEGGMQAMALVLRSRGDMIEALPTSGDFPRGGKLVLTLTSADSSGASRVYKLAPSELGWRGVGSLDGEHDWLVQLAPDNAGWLVHGRWTPQARFIRLMP